MSIRTVITFVHTEYHLLLFINRLIQEEVNGIQNNHQLFIRDQGKSRVSKNLDLTGVKATVHHVSEEFVSHKPLSKASKNKLYTLMTWQPYEFVFYQEMDLLMIILANYWKKKHKTKILLFQDGAKPYNILKFNSVSLIKHHHKINVWLKKNGFQIDSWFAPLWSHRYAYLKAIDEVHLTFPNSYINWNQKKVIEIKFPYKDKLISALSDVFGWKNEWFPENEKIILYMSQPMQDDGKIESNFIEQLSKKFNNHKIYIKPHPLTPQVKLDEYSKYDNFEILNLSVPAELIIFHISNSIILSVNSTSMYVDNPKNKFYYLNKIFEKNIKRLRRYKITMDLSPHLIGSKSIDDINF